MTQANSPYVEEGDSRYLANEVLQEVCLPPVAPYTPPPNKPKKSAFEKFTLTSPSCLLLQDYSNLTKADIFALGLTVVSASGAEALPLNGLGWHKIRQGELPTIPCVLASEFLSLLEVIVQCF